MSTAVKKQIHPRPSGKSPTIGLYLLDKLQSLGVEHIFGIPGDYIIRFDKLIEQHPIEFINTTRENTAGYMADAYARVRGLGVACITYGVGVNIANAVSQAYVESSPLVLISGAAGTDELMKGHFLHHLINKGAAKGAGETTQLKIFTHITVAQTVLNDPNRAQEEIDRVLNACLLHKKPVYIEIPRNMVDAPLIIQELDPQPAPTSDADALKEALNEAAAILKKSQRPFLWIGHEIQRYGLAPFVLQFAEKYHIPIVSSLLGKGVINERHPLFVGVYQGTMSQTEVIDFVENSDCAILLGLLITDVDTGIFTAKLDHEGKIIASVDNLAIGHHYFLDVLFSDFVKGLSGMECNLRFREPYPARIDRETPPFKAASRKKITTKRTFECIQNYLRPDYLLVTDTGDCLFGSVDLIVEQNSFISGAYFASLGFGTPGAIGAQVAASAQRVIEIVGDGAFQMTSMELSTAVRYNLDPIVILLNNHGYGTERPLLEGSYNDILNWNYTDIPKVLGGGVGIKVSTEEELDAALKEATAQRGTFYLIEVELEKTDFSPALRRLGELAKVKSSDEP